MNEEIEGVVPEDVVTVTTEAEEVKLPADDSEIAEPVIEKKFSQEELDAIVQKRIAREHRKWAREQAVPTQNVSPVVDSGLRLTDFATPEDYAEALAERKAEQKLAAREQQKHQLEVSEGYAEREEKARDKYDDFDSVVYNDSLSINTLMADTIKAAENGPDIAYFLGQNPKEAQRISKLPAHLQPYEIGKIEAKLASSPPVKKTTSAPAPIVPVSARSVGNASFETTDPRSVKTMTTSDWIKAEEARMRKALEKKYR